MEFKKQKIFWTASTLWRGFVMWFLSGVLAGILGSLLMSWIKHAAQVKYPYPFYFHGEFPVITALILSSFLAALTASVRYGRLGWAWGLFYGLLSGSIIGGIVAGVGGSAFGQLGLVYILPVLGIIAGVAGGILGEKLGTGRRPGEEIGEDTKPAADVQMRLSEIEKKLAGLENGTATPGWFSAIESRIRRLEIFACQAGKAGEPEKKAEPAAVEQPAAGPPEYQPEPVPGLEPQPEPEPQQSKPFSLEDMLTAKVFARVGIASLVLGVAFFLKYVIENNWVGPMGRVTGGIISGIALIGLGDSLHSKEFKGYGQTLMGGGLAILYLSFYAGFHFYSLIPQVPAFVAMIFVTSTAVVLSIRHSSRTIAITGILGGFLTPYLMSTGVVVEVPLFTYLVVLNLGVLGVSMFMNWREFGLLAFALTQIWLQTYFSTAYKPELRTTMAVFSGLYFAIFLAVTLIHNIRRKLTSKPADLILLLANGFLYFTTVYYKFLEGSGLAHLESFFAVSMGVLYLLSAWYVVLCNRQDRFMILAQLGMGTAFVTIAIPIAFDWHWVTIGFAAEALVLAWLGFRLDDRWTRFGAVALFAAASVRLLVFDAPLRGEYSFLLTARTASFVLGLASLALAAYLYYANPEKTGDDELWVPPSIAVVWNFLLLVWLSVETNGFWNDYYVRHGLNVTIESPLSGAYGRIQASYSVIWVFHSLALMTIGILKESRLVRNMAIALLSVVTVKVFLVDLSSIGLGPRMISFMALGSILLLISYGYQKYIGGKS